MYLKTGALWGLLAVTAVLVPALQLLALPLLNSSSNLFVVVGFGMKAVSLLALVGLAVLAALLVYRVVKRFSPSGYDWETIKKETERIFKK